MVENVLQTIGFVVVAGGGLASIVYAIFKRFGEKWLDEKFEERLASYKHEQQKELEQLRFKISALLDRTTKLHQREFDVLPEAWSRLNDAYWKASSFISPMQRYPNLDRMTDKQLGEFLAECELDDWEQDELRAAEAKKDYYITHVFWHRLDDTKTTARESHVYLLKNGIFLTLAVKEKFTKLETLIWEALDEHEFNQQYDQIPRKSDKKQALLCIGPEQLKALEAEVQGRLWSTKADAP